MGERYDSAIERITIRNLKKQGLKHTQALRVWQAPHVMKIVDGEIEVCSTCTNSEGNPIAWDFVKDEPNHV